MDFDKAKKKLAKGSKQVVRGTKTGLISADLAWKTLGSPVPLPQQPNTARTHEPLTTWKIENPSSLQSQNENYADHWELIEQERRSRALQAGIHLRDPDIREERPRKRER